MNTTAQVKQNIKKSVQQMQAEPLEILKTAQEQIFGEELKPNQRTQKEYKDLSPQTSSEELSQKKEGIIADNRNLEALQSEMRDIRRQKLFDKLLQRIQNGEYVAVEEFQELSHEQRDVLKAQLEAVRGQRENAKNANDKPLIEPSSKKSRRFGGFGKRKNPAEKQQTRVEMPLPPSG